MTSPTPTQHRKYITPEQYNDAPEDLQDWYAPEYKKYKIKKVRGYETCDLGYTHFVGWIEQKTPISDPYRYSRVSPFEHMLQSTRRLTQSTLIDNISNSNILLDRIIGKWS